MERFTSFVLPRVLAVLLWLATVILGLADIYFALQIFVTVYARFFNDPGPAGVLYYVLLLILPLIYLAVIVLTGEYHLKHAGQPGSWRLFAQTLAVLIAIPLLAFFVVGNLN
jgi:hypothetical protein